MLEIPKMSKYETRLFIDGKPVDAKSGKTYDLLVSALSFPTPLPFYFYFLLLPLKASIWYFCWFCRTRLPMSFSQKYQSRSATTSMQRLKRHRELNLGGLLYQLTFGGISLESSPTWWQRIRQRWLWYGRPSYSRVAHKLTTECFPAGFRLHG